MPTQKSMIHGRATKECLPEAPLTYFNHFQILLNCTMAAKNEQKPFASPNGPILLFGIFLGQCSTIFSEGIVTNAESTLGGVSNSRHISFNSFQFLAI